MSIRSLFSVSFGPKVEGIFSKDRKKSIVTQSESGFWNSVSGLQSVDYSRQRSCIQAVLLTFVVGPRGFIRLQEYHTRGNHATLP